MNDDLISRQAAIDALCKVGCGSGHCGISCDDVKAIEQLPSAQPVMKWIPVTERLPEEKQDVLLAFRHNMVVGFWEDILNDGSQAWYANSGNAWFTGTESVDDDGIPIAWMPLPEPWRGEEDDT